MGVNDFSFNILKDISKEGEGSDWFSVLLCFPLHLSVLQGSCRIFSRMRLALVLSHVGAGTL